MTSFDNGRDAGPAAAVTFIALGLTTTPKLV